MGESEGRDEHARPEERNAIAAARKLSYLLAVAMATQALLGVLLPDQYRDVAWVRASWFGNDLVTLMVAVPMLLVTLAAARRGSVRGSLVWIGVLAYAVYNDAFYLHGAALNVFFPLYLLVLATNAVVAIALGQASWPGEFPAWAGLFVLMATATTFLLAAARRGS
jgi:hypothetical protein